MKMRCSSSFIFFTTIWLLPLIQENICCETIPTELLAIVGETVSFRCNAKSNNELKSTVLKLTLGSEETSGTVIYQPTVYGPNNRVLVEQKIADGYFLSDADVDLFNATIQINETQLKHGGKYVCTCAGSISSVGTLNLAVLEPKPAFVRNDEKQIIPGEITDLNCSMSFSGSTTSVSVDLTILNATGDLLANRSNLQLMQSITGHYVTYTVIADRNQHQNFTCTMKVWGRNFDGKRNFYSSSSSFYFNWGQESTIEYETTSGHSSKSANTTLVAVLGAIGIFIAVLMIGLFVLIRRRRRYPRHNYGEPIYAEPTERGREITHTKNNGVVVEENKVLQKCEVDNELVVFDNAVYAETPRFDPSRQPKVEQIYNEVL